MALNGEERTHSKKNHHPVLAGRKKFKTSASIIIANNVFDAGKT
jgi:hypothetical protein